MDERDGGATATTDHAAAAEAFVDRARSRFPDEIQELYVFGSTARGDASGLASDVDVLVALADSSDHDTVAEALRDIAYDVMVEYGPVVELHIFTEQEFERHKKRDNPFVTNVVTEGRSYA